MSAETEWFERTWCKPQGHKHDSTTELGCLIRVLGALRGEEPALREAFVEAAIQAEKINRPAPPAGAKANDWTTRFK